MLLWSVFSSEMHSFTTHISILTLICANTAFAQSSPVMGFSEKTAADQLALEADFDKLIKADNLDTWMQYMTARPHHVGSVYDKKVVDYIAKNFRKWGYDVRV